MRLALAGLLALAGCVQAPSPCPSVPALPSEEIPKPPPSEPAPTWQPGYVDWDGSRYSFVPGRWIIRTGPDTNWMRAYWTRDPGAETCRWVPAHWL